jgi:hypothetical protein
MPMTKREPAAQSERSRSRLGNVFEDIRVVIEPSPVLERPTHNKSATDYKFFGNKTLAWKVWVVSRVFTAATVVAHDPD